VHELRALRRAYYGTYAGHSTSISIGAYNLHKISTLLVAKRTRHCRKRPRGNQRRLGSVAKGGTRK